MSPGVGAEEKINQYENTNLINVFYLSNQSAHKNVELFCNKKIVASKMQLYSITSEIEVKMIRDKDCRF